MSTTTRPKATPSGKLHCHHITQGSSPVAILPPLPLPCSGGWEGAIVEYEGTPGYVWTDACGETGIFRTAYAIDAGDNVLGSRTAPASTKGLCATRPIPTTIICDELLAWVDS